MWMLSPARASSAHSCSPASMLSAAGWAVLGCFGPCAFLSEYLSEPTVYGFPSLSLSGSVTAADSAAGSSAGC